MGQRFFPIHGDKGFFPLLPGLLKSFFPYPLGRSRYVYLELFWLVLPCQLRTFQYPLVYSIFFISFIRGCGEAVAINDSIQLWFMWCLVSIVISFIFVLQFGYFKKGEFTNLKLSVFVGQQRLTNIHFFPISIQLWDP